MPDKKRPQDITKTERLLRVHKVYEMLLASKSKVKITAYCRDKWGVKEPTAREYVKDAHKAIAESLQGNKIEKLNKAIAQRENIIDTLIENEAYGLLLQYMVDKSKLEKLYDDASINITDKSKVYIGMRKFTDAEKKAALTESGRID